jgi:hypothetical protein
LQLLFDLPFASNEMKLHHVFGIICIFAKYFISGSNDDWHLIHSIYKTEISSFFYVLKIWLEEKNAFTSRLSNNQTNMAKQINNALFYLTFFKFRIYDFTQDVIFNTEGFYVMEKYTKGIILNRVILYSGLVGLYLMNLYWFFIMTKILCKQTIVKMISTKTAVTFDRTFTKYSYFLHIPIVIYVYSTSPNESYYFDMTGIVCLSMACYQYHSAILNYFNENQEIVATSYDIIGNFAVDQVSIHSRYLYSVITALYHSPHFNLILIPTTLHIASCTATIYNLYKLKRNNVIAKFEPMNEEGKKLIDFTYLTVFTPFALDIIIIILQSHSTIARIKLLLLCYLGILLSIIQPFYLLNHSIFHFGLYFQSYYISQCNLR